MIGDLGKCRELLAHCDDDGRDDFFSNVVYNATIYDRCCILELVFSMAKKRTLEYKHSAMYYAALNGNRKLCEFICGHVLDDNEWKRCSVEIRANVFAEMMTGATIAGRIDLFELGREWCEEYVHSLPNLSGPLQRAALNGTIDICKRALSLASDHGQETNIDNVLQWAAQGNQRAMCEFAKERGARNFASMFYGAAVGEDIELCKLAREWLDAAGQCDLAALRDMMMIAVRVADFEIFRIAYEWWIAKLGHDINLAEIREIFIGSAKSGGLKACEFLYDIMSRYAREHGGDETRALMTEIIEEAMAWSVALKCTKVCKFMHSCGARNYEMCLDYADTEDHDMALRGFESYNGKTRALVAEWIAERDAAQ